MPGVLCQIKRHFVRKGPCATRDAHWNNHAAFIFEIIRVLPLR